MIAVRKIDPLGRIVLPKELREELGWVRDTSLVVERLENGILLHPYESPACADDTGREP